MRTVSPSYPKVSIKKGREWQLAHGHPWLFSGAISQAPNVPPGSLVDLVDVDGKFVARGYYNPACDIAVRVLTGNKDTVIDSDFFRDKIAAALRLRTRVIDRLTTNAFRLINAEGDFLPGYIVDYYAGLLVVQSHTAGSDALLPSFLEALQSVVEPTAVVLRNDASVRKREGLQIEAAKIISGELPASGELEVLENGLRFLVDPLQGQKTGFFADQRDKRVALQLLCRELPPGATMANCFSYTGSFGVYAKAINADMRVINVDESSAALAQARRNFALNNLKEEDEEFVEGDAFAWLESQHSRGRQFDIVIIDPPAFAKTQKDVEKALKAYRRLNKLASMVTKSGGILVSCSCSGSVSMSDFENTLKDATHDSSLSVQIINTFRHGPDHPVSVMLPEANYLKVLFCRVLR